VRLAALTIGQAPRIDIMADFKDIFSQKTMIVERGALDNLSKEEIGRISPSKDDYILISRLRDGTSAKISGQYVERKLQYMIEELEDEIDMFLILCAGTFPHLKSKKSIMKPDVLLNNSIPGLIGKGMMVDVVPLEEQVEELKTRWSFDNISVKYKSLCPYTSTMKEVILRAKETKEMNPDLILLDCFGFGKDTKKIFQDATSKPVILVRTFVASIVKELLE